MVKAASGRVMLRLPADVQPGAILDATLPDGKVVRFEAPEGARGGMLVDILANEVDDDEEEIEVEDEDEDTRMEGVVSPTMSAAAPRGVI